MPFLAACAFCGRESQVPDSAVGTSMRCPACSNFYSPAPKAVASAPVTSLPFVARCSCCGYDCHVPAAAVGASMRCPRCSNLFTVVRRKRRTDKAVHVLVGESAPSAEAPWASDPDAWWASPLEVPPELPPEPPARIAAASPVHVTNVSETPRVFHRPTKATPPKRAEDDEQPLRGVDPLSVGVLFLACAALLCASIWWLCGVVVPVSCVALFAAGIVVVRARRSGTSLGKTAGAGAALAAAVLLTALLFPGLLGPTYRVFKDQDAINPEAIRRIPLAGSQPSTAPEDPEWANAATTALQQGRVTVQILEVSVSRVANLPNKKGQTELCLVVRLLVQLIPDAGKMTATQNDAVLLKEEFRVTMTDVTGKRYGLLDVQVGGAADKGRGASEFGLASRILVFQGPAADLQNLRLEIPAGAWGGTGMFRFAIASAMIQRKSSG